MRAVWCLVLLSAALATAQRQEERAHAEAACKKQLPKCTTRSSLFVEPPHPCANRGAACPPELLAKQTTGGLWSCTCLGCKTSAQCSPGWACEGDGKKKRCVPGPPTNGPEPLPPSSAPTPQP